MKQFSSDIRYVEATPRKQRKKSGAYSVISAGVSSSADNSALKSYVDSNFMSLATGQDVSALHNFLNGFYIAGIPFSKMDNGSLFIDANVVFGGGVTMYGTDSTPAPSIFDGLPIDNETIYWDNGVLKAMGGGGGGGVADSVAWANVYGKPTWITNTKPTYNYSEIQGTPDLSVYALASAIPTNNNQLTNGAGYITASALNGYATQTFVNTAVNGAKEWVEEQQYLTEITSGMIESVLGYQPYDGYTNRLGFLTSSALNGYATQSWVNTALAGYLPKSGGTVNGSITASSFIGNLTGNADSATNADTLDGKHATDLVETKSVGATSNSLDLNSRKSVDTWFSTAWAFEGSDNVLNQPWTRSAANVWTLPGRYPLQIARFYTSSAIKVRGSGGSAWYDWKDIAFTDSNVASATKLETPRTIWGQSFDGTGNVSGDAIIDGTAYTQKFRAIANSSTNPTLGAMGSADFGMVVASGTTSTYGLYGWITGSGDSHLQTGREDGNTTPYDLIFQELGGNVGIGTDAPESKLHVNGNTRLTGNLIFDSSNLFNIQRKLNSTGGITTFIQVNSSDNLLIGQGIAKAGKNTYIYGNEMIFAYGTAGTTSSAAMHIYSNGNVSIGGTTASAKLHVYGDLLTTGGITMYSQRSLKNILSYEGLSLEQLSVIKPIKFTWKDGRDNRYHVGGVADDVATVVPEVVYSANDFLTMDYGNAGFYVAASLIKPVIDHELRIKILEQENKALREEINQLRQSA